MAEKRKKRAVATIPADETPEQRFVRLAEPRVSKAIKSIAAIGKLTGSRYSYTSVQATRIIDALKHVTGIVEKQFAGKNETQTVFKL